MKTNRTTGKVKWFRGIDKTGYIAPNDGGQSLYFDSSVAKGNFKTGDSVSFECAQCLGRSVAIKVKKQRGA